MAFPNAYVSTDEPPRRPHVRTALCLTTILGVGYLGGVILVLSLLWGEYSPITQAASDYGVGAYAPAMNTGFFVAGAGFMALAAAVFPSAGRSSVRAGSVLFLPAGLALVTNAFFQTNLEGTAATFDGTVHALGGLVFFTTAPLGLLLTSVKFSGNWSGLLAAALLLAFASLALPAVFGINAGGLGERLLILVVFSGAMLTAFRSMKEA